MAPARVLFVCTHNSARSQMAEALARRHGDERVEAHSAGTDAGRVNPLTVEVLAEVGIDWAAASSKSVAAFVGQPFDYIVTVCDSARESCPVFPGGTRTLHWSIDDPAAVTGPEPERLAAFRRARDEIDGRVRALLGGGQLAG